LSEGKRDPFAALRGGQNFPKGGDTPLPTQASPPTPQPELPLATPQPKALSWATLRRGLTRGGLTLCITLAALLLSIGPYFEGLSLAFVVPLFVSQAMLVAAVVGMCVAERYLAQRKARPGVREWTLLCLALLVARVLQQVWNGYLREFMTSLSVAKAMEEAGSALTSVQPFLLLAVFFGGLPWVLLVYMRLTGKPLGRQVAWLLVANFIAALITSKIRSRGFFSWGGWLVVNVVCDALLAVAWHYGDVISDKRWGRVPATREAVQALLVPPPEASGG
jgi:hypothetical protein